MNPTMKIDSKAILSNFNALKALTQKHGIKMSVVTKGLVGYEPLVKLLVENGADSICEAHIQNLIKFKDLPVEKWMIRSPLISEAAEIVKYADISCASEIAVLESLSAVAVSQGRIHKIVVMLELGELREGCMPEEVIPVCKACIDLPGLELYGIGGHLSSLFEIAPDEQNMKYIADTAANIEKELGLKLPVVSGGSSAMIKMLQDGTLPQAINHLRLGEAVLFGTIACYDVPFNGAITDAFNLYAEIIEIKEKPSMPWGDRAPNALSIYKDSEFKDIGIRKRALVAIGRQDLQTKYLIPHDPDLKIVAATCDCFVADITDCKKEYKPGDFLGFSLRYHGVVTAIASDFVDKIMF